MITQRDVFIAGEADAWMDRNRPGMERFAPEKDTVVRLVRPHLRRGARVAEVGCSMGQRVAALTELSAGHGYGIDPSAKAIAAGLEWHPALRLECGTAERLPWDDASMDVLVYGFCLYLCDRGDLFRIAAEGDRVLKAGGILAVLDFVPPHPYRNDYSHRAGVFSYKMDHSSLWRWNPAYVEVARELHDHGGANGSSTLAPDDRVGVTLLKKLPEFAYAARPDYR